MQTPSQYANRLLSKIATSGQQLINADFQPVVVKVVHEAELCIRPAIVVLVALILVDVVDVSVIFEPIRWIADGVLSLLPDA